MRKHNIASPRRCVTVPACQHPTNPLKRPAGATMHLRAKSAGRCVTAPPPYRLTAPIFFCTLVQQFLDFPLSTFSRSSISSFLIPLFPCFRVSCFHAPQFHRSTIPPRRCRAAALPLCNGGAEAQGLKGAEGSWYGYIAARWRRFSARM